MHIAQRKQLRIKGRKKKDLISENLFVHIMITAFFNQKKEISTDTLGNIVLGFVETQVSLMCWCTFNQKKLNTKYILNNSKQKTVYFVF